MKHAKVIAFAGLDGSGKSTQIEAIKRILETQGYKVKIQQHFTSPIGEKCREIIQLSKDPHIRALTFALDEYAQKLNNLEDSDYDVILCDRSHYCAYAYSGAQGIKVDWINVLYEHSQKYDLCIYLDITLNTSYKHKGFDSISPNLSVQQFEKVRDNYLSLVDMGKLVKVNAEQEFTIVTEEINSLVMGAIK
ncbi:MAG TPA: dTMP kinase [Lachnospiraceae bacterium]|nr:dTMP kinase [Lachnospiraceae bacterium]